MDKNKRWNTPTKIIVITMLIAGAIWLLVAVKAMLTALSLAALVAYLFFPLSQKISRLTRLSSAWAARAVFLGLVLFLGGIPATLGAIVAEQFHILEGEFLDAIDAIESWGSRPIGILGYEIYPRILVENLVEAAGGVLSAIPKGSLDFLSGVTTNLLWGVLFFFGVYYFLKDGQQLMPWLIQMAPAEHQSDFRRLLSELDEVWGVFLRAQILMFFILGVLMGTGFLLVIWLFRSGLIPFSPLLFILLIVLVVTVAQQIDNLLLRPQLMGKSLHIHPGLVLTGLTGALMVGGFLWAFFSVPLMATAKVLGRYIYCQLYDLPPWQDGDMESQEECSEPAGNLDGQEDSTKS